MAEAKIDPNNVKTWLAYNETTGLTEPIRVDPVTEALYVYGVTNTAGSPTAINNFKRDGNHVTVEGAYNETTGLVEAMRCSNDGSLLILD